MKQKLVSLELESFFLSRPSALSSPKFGQAYVRIKRVLLGWLGGSFGSFGKQILYTDNTSTTIQIATGSLNKLPSPFSTVVESWGGASFEALMTCSCKMRDQAGILKLSLQAC